MSMTASEVQATAERATARALDALIEVLDQKTRADLEALAAARRRPLSQVLLQELGALCARALLERDSVRAEIEKAKRGA